MKIIYNSWKATSDSHRDGPNRSCSGMLCWEPEPGYRKRKRAVSRFPDQAFIDACRFVSPSPRRLTSQPNLNCSASRKRKRGSQPTHAAIGFPTTAWIPIGGISQTRGIAARNMQPKEAPGLLLLAAPLFVETGRIYWVRLQHLVPRDQAPCLAFVGQCGKAAVTHAGKGILECGDCSHPSHPSWLHAPVSRQTAMLP